MLPAPPQTFTPRHLAEKILAGRDALQGERKHVTVLFGDVVGSTELIRDRDPEDAQRLLDGAVRVMMDAVHRYEGTVSRLMGDGLMAMFGAPVAHEDHAVRACFAALAMLDAIRAYAESARRSDGAVIQIRVGLNSGEVIVRLISDDLHMDYTALGQSVHVASRMEGLAHAGAALISPSTLALVEGFVEVRPLGPMPVKGLDQPLAVYELQGADAQRTRFQASAARGLTPFVGRQEERVAIDRALARVRTGQGQVVALVAEAGVGKSRLVWETIHGEQASDFRVFETGAVSYGQTTAWLPVSGLLRHFFQIERHDDHPTMRTKVLGGLLALAPELDADGPAILSLLDVLVEDAAWVALDGRQRRAAMLDAMRRLVLRESQRRPVLLIVEDLHWLDSETQALLDGLVEVLPTARIMLLVNYRPEFTHQWGNRPCYTQVRIDPLEQPRADELLDALLGSDPTVRSLKPLLIRRTEGTPLFLEESVRSLVETAALVGERGAYRLVRDVEEIRVPATVQAVLAARIDRLPPQDKRLLQVAAVIGKDVPFTLLEAIGGLPDADLRSALRRLQAGELLYSVAVFPSLELSFKHALTHDVAYGSLLQEQRRGLHVQVMTAIEQCYAESLEGYVVLLGHHAMRGEAWERALTYCRQAGSRALMQSAVRDAATWLEQALVAVRRLPARQDIFEAAADIGVDLRNALNALNEAGRAYEFLCEAEWYAEQIGDRRRLARILVSMNSYLQNREPARAMMVGERAVAIGEELGDPGLQAAGYHALGQDHHARAEFQQAVACFERGLDCMDAVSGGRGEILGSTSFLSAHSRSCQGWSLAELGQLSAAIEIADEGARRAEQMGHTTSLVGSQIYQGIVRVRSGQSEGAIAILERNLEMIYALGIEDGIMFEGTAGTLGEAYVQVGRIDVAIPLLERARQLTVDRQSLTNYFLAAVPLAEAYLRAGRVGEAEDIADEAISCSIRDFEPHSRARALRVLAMIRVENESPTARTAEQIFQEAIGMAESLGMLPLQARCRLGLGTHYRRSSRPTEARVELTRALGLLRDLGMTRWLPEAEAELARLDEA